MVSVGGVILSVTDRELEQWFLRVTKYSQHLLDGIDELTEWPEKVLTMQQNWIGRSEGALVQFPIVPLANTDDDGASSKRSQSLSP